jgi:ATPase subunit of ABC transporter with duplicated ATPase domains
MSALVGIRNVHKYFTRGSERVDVLQGVNLDVPQGEFLALMGPSGSGKTTLVEALLGRMPLAAGTRTLGAGVVVGELEQSRAAFSVGEPALQTFVRATSMRTEDARTLLAKFGLGPDHLARAAASLSPGERTRASLALLMASGANWLVLDEPTNHLDLPAIEQLESALNAFDGTLLLVTHDRQLLSALTIDRTIELAARITAPDRQ